jgi:septal ring factor EnvC (AmiA/AmiB activator)
MRKDLAKAEEDENAKDTRAQQLEEELKVIKQVNLEYYAEATGFTRTFEKVKAMNDEIDMREKNRKAMLQGMKVMTGQLAFPYCSSKLTGRIFC